MRIAIVVYCNGALSLPCGWGQPARGLIPSGGAFLASSAIFGLREALLGLLFLTRSWFFFHLLL